MKKKKVVETDIFDSFKEDLPGIIEYTRPKMSSEKELKTLIKTFDSELERKKTIPDLNPDKVQYWFNPIVAMFYYGGLQKQNRPTTSKAVKKCESDIRPI